jgi:hypothetical protein
MKTRDNVVASCSARLIAAGCLLLIASMTSTGCDMEDMEDMEGEEPGLDEPMDVDPTERVDAVDAPSPSADADPSVLDGRRPRPAPWVLPRGERLNRGRSSRGS